jgi:Calcineurin-like phosphoesterase
MLLSDSRCRPRTAASRAVSAAAVIAVAVLSLAGTTLPAHAAVSTALLRYPYLTDVVGTSATVNWGTDRSATSGSVSYGKVGAESCTAHQQSGTRFGTVVNGVSEYQWHARLVVEPDTQYCYRVQLSGQDLLGSDPSPAFWTQVPAGSTSSFSFAVFGDWGVAHTAGNPDQAAVMAQIARSGARFAVTTGDNAYSTGRQKNYGDLVQVGDYVSGVFGPAFWTVPGRSIPNFPTLGNHGYTAPENPNPHLVNWPQDSAVSGSGGTYGMQTYCCLDGTSSDTYPTAWYAFDVGNARFYILDASWDESNVGTATMYEVDRDYHWTTSSAEYQWLLQDLAGHANQVKFAFLHFPMYSDALGQHSDTFLQGPTDTLESLFNQYDVDIAFSGHAHVYERNVPTQGDRFVTYVTGGGGAQIGSLGTCQAYDAYAIGWSFSSNAGRACGAASPPTSPSGVFHFLLVTVSGTNVTVQPTDESGNVFDAQTYSVS